MSDSRHAPAPGPPTVGPYTLLGELGRGGMGTVYRARDNRLRRDVALKVLRADLHLTPERLARFENEARVVAALNHPNIAALYGIEDGAAGIQALVLELVEGPSLAARIAANRPGLAEALDIASQIAQALDAAHERGVVHRDLKPANIVITPTGLVKVLDFGVAKMTDPGEVTNETVTVTREGVIVGTPAYMSPEQATGQSVDERTDIWAFGCVLFEMLTGRRAFDGSTAGDTLSAVLSATPDWSLLPTTVPSTVVTLMKRCLERERAKRLGNVAAIRFALEDLPAAVDHPRAWSRRAVLTAATGIVAAAGGFMAGKSRPVRAEPETTRRNDIAPPDGYSFLPVVDGGPIALSPDGRRIAYVLRGPTGMQSLWVQSLDDDDPQPLPGTEGAAAPFWSPNSDQLAFFADGKLKKIRVGGGAPQELADKGDFSSQGAMPGTWSRDDNILYDRVNQLWRVSVNGGERDRATDRDVKAFDENHYSPFFLPDNRHYLLLVRGGTELRLTLVIGELGSKVRTPLLKNVTNAQYAPGRNGRRGHVIFVRDTQLVAQAFDEQQLTLTGPEVTLADDVAVTGGGGLGDFSVSPGVLAYRRSPRSTSDMVWVDRDGKVTGTLGDRPGHPRNTIRIAPNGALAAFTRDDAGQGQDVWLIETNAKSSDRARKFTRDGGRTPVWSPDGSEIAYLRGNTVYRKNLNGSAEHVVWTHDGIMAINDWSGDGKHFLLTVWDTTDRKDGSIGRGLWLLSDLSSPSTHLANRDGGDHGVFAPLQGATQWITSDGVKVQSMPGTTSQLINVGDGERSRQPRWRRSGKELFLADDENISAVNVTWTPTLRFSPPRPLFRISQRFRVAFSQFAPGWDVMPDGQRFLVVNPSLDTPAASIAIVTNWDVEMARRTGGDQR